MMVNNGNKHIGIKATHGKNEGHCNIQASIYYKT